MKTWKLLIILLWAHPACPGYAQGPAQEMIRDLRQDWMVSDKGSFRPKESEYVRKIFFTVEAPQFSGKALCISDDQPFAVFVEHQLIFYSQRGAAILNIDSLSALYSTHLKFSVFQEKGITTLKTYLIGPVTAEDSEQNLFPRKGDYFLNFSLLASLILFGFLVLLLRTNPRLTLDYLNVFKLFARQEREDSLLSGRITSRVNLLFYVFCSLLCALILLVVFHLSHHALPISVYFLVRTTGEGFVQWMKLSALIATLLSLKLLILLSFSILFKVRDKVSVQFFNFIRALYLAVGFLVIVCTLNFVVHGHYGRLDLIWIKISAGILVLAVLMMYIKLLALTRYHFFHLFSYLCASEIIPLAILLKILLY